MNIDSTDVGKQFCAWTVIGPWFTWMYKPGVAWRAAVCQCHCGTTAVIQRSYLTRGKRRWCSRCSAKQKLRTHGMSHLAEYKVWEGMKQRCENAAHESYGRYGGRGITICARWRESFESFLEDMGPRPSKKHSIDRIDNDGNYEPANCRWATTMEQKQNTSRNVFITFNGETLCCADWSRRLGISDDTICRRLKAGWPIERVLAIGKQVARGENQGNSKLTNDCVREMRRLKNEGSSNKAIAEKFGVHPAVVSLIVNRKSWSHVF